MSGTPWGWFRSPLSGSVRARVVALGFLAAIPSVGMAGIIAGQDYRGREREILEHAARLQGVAVAQIGIAVAALNGSLVGSTAVAPDAALKCADGWAAELNQVTKTSAVAAYDDAGGLLCRRGAAAGLREGASERFPWFHQAQDGAAPILGLAADGKAIVATATPGHGVMAAALPADWFAAVTPPEANPAETAFWLFDAAGDIIASTGIGPEALPPVDTLAALRRSPGAVLARSAVGTHYAYASTGLSNGWQVIGAYNAARGHRKALWVLYNRLIDLAGLLLLSLATTVLGADIAFGDPLRRLRSALLAWQHGGEFDGRGLVAAPTELVALAQSFARATVSLRKQKAELEQARARQELLMLEIHHRVKNNLQIVASLLNLQASRIRVPEARAEFQSARDRVRALATLHRHLYYEGEINSINMASFLVELCGQLFQAMGEVSGQRIKLCIEAEPLRLSTDQAVPLALIVTEAVTNAIKYGFPDGRRGTVTILLAQHDGSIDLEVADDGVGIPPGRGETETGTRDGIGMQLIRGFSRQLGAALEVQHNPGTRYSVHVPLHFETPEDGTPEDGTPEHGTAGDGKRGDSKASMP